jgi:UDP-N-acetylmuramoyl-tripeptide--D-alanyl-D-alanine ligase
MMMSQLATLLDANLYGDDATFNRVSKDTRTISDGDLYVALIGERFDGHDFIDQAKRAGAAGALVSKRLPVELPQVEVEDTRLALGRYAKWWANAWRDQFKGRLIGITGSNGKTSVKEMCKHILSMHAGDSAVLATRGNLNNDIGMPLMLLELSDVHRYAVIEMGANHVGEINYLTHVACPDVALVNNVGPAHLEGFGSMDNIAKAKAEIYDGIADHGTAIINLDDKYSQQWLQNCRQKSNIEHIVTFSMQDRSATVYAEKLAESYYAITCDGITSELTMSVPGEHNVMNALAAISATINVGVPFDDAVQALTDFKNIGGRLAIRESDAGYRVIDDTYNANPLSVKAAINVLSEFDSPKVLVLGDMAELGSDQESLHKEIGDYAKQKGIDHLFVTGRLVVHAVEAFADNGHYFESKSALIEALNDFLTGREVVLVKGSRSAAMEEVVERILTHDNKSKRGN